MQLQHRQTVFTCKIAEMVNKKGTRKCLQTLQPSGVDKENLVGTGRFHENKPDPKISKPQFETEVDVKTDENKSVVDAKAKPSLYKKLIIQDLNNIVGPSTSEKYWEVVAERRRKALEEVLEQNSKLHTLITALKEENSSCKKSLEKTTNLLNTLNEVIKKKDDKSAEDYVDNDNSSINSDEIIRSDDFCDSESE
ncbi:PREDICTED: geminin-like [Diuraphis noxia]|uniref:geminin-like n=1 Tax=Diuraphis noxia TaxID=143948 RepID=UPI000763814B|nr:PREDICTED: geminin-like [Diuraphis noxia]